MFEVQCVLAEGPKGPGAGANLPESGKAQGPGSGAQESTGREGREESRGSVAGRAFPVERTT